MSLNDIADILWENNFKKEAIYLREFSAIIFEGVFTDGK
jgi:hypothetical protein